MTENTLPPKQTISPGGKGGKTPSDWQIGETILDTYEVKGTLGKGGFGVVYRVHHKSWNIDLAVKRALTLEEENKQSFIDEAQHWIDLGLHPHIISCYYVRNIDGFPHTFAELAEGGSLHDWIQRDSYDLYEGSKEQALQRILDIAIQFAWGLAYAHQQGLVHQDVKPQNALMTPEGILKVTDFGLAKARGSAKSGRQQAPAGDLLVSGGAYSPYHCSPEQAGGEKLSLKTDIWSWAVSVLEMFNGGVSWLGGQVADTALESYLQRAGEEEYIPPMPQGLADLLRQCLQPDPKARPVDMLTVGEHLLPIYQQETGQAYPRQMPKAAELRADSLNNKALSLLDLGKYKVAVESWQKALEIDPQHPGATYNLGMWRWQAGLQTDLELVQQLEVVSNIQPDAWMPHYLLGLAHKQRRDIESAKKAFGEAERIFPGSSLVQEVLKRLEVIQPFKLLRTFEESTVSIYTLAITSDGRKVISGSGGYDRSNDRTIHLWNLETGKCLQTLDGHRGPVSTLVITPNGRRVISGSDDRTLRIWDMESGKCLLTLEGLKFRVNALAISPDGRLALSGSGNYQSIYRERALCLWDLATGKCLYTYEGHTGSVYAVGITPDGRKAISGSNDNTLRVWDLKNGKCIKTLVGHTSTIYSLAITADERRVISGSFDRTVRVWDLESGNCLRILEGHTDSVHTLAITPDGLQAISGSKDKTLRVWDLKSGRCLRTLEGHTDGVYTVVIMPNERQFVSGGKDKAIRVWELPTEPWQTPEWVVNRPSVAKDIQAADLIFQQYIQKAEMAIKNGQIYQAAVILKQALQFPGYEREPLLLNLWHMLGQKSGQIQGLRTTHTTHILSGHTGIVQSLTITPDSQKVVSSSEDKTVRVWNLDNGECLHTFEGFKGYGTRFVITPDGSRVVTGNNQDVVRVWDLESGKCLRSFSQYVNTLAITPDGHRIVSCSNNGKLRYWDLENGQNLRTLEGQGSTLAITRDGRKLVSGNKNKLTVWDLESGKCLNTLTGHTSFVISLAITPDERGVISGSLDNTLRLWDLESGQCLRTMEGHTGSVETLAITLDGRVVISGSGDNTIRVWDLESGDCFHTLMGHRGKVSTLALTSDGRRVVSGSGDHTINIWMLDWDYAFPEPADWDESARPYLEIFLTLHTQYGPDSFTRQGKPVWTEEDFQKFLIELGHRGYGWLREEGIRKKLAEMAVERR